MERSTAILLSGSLKEREEELIPLIEKKEGERKPFSLGFL